MLLYDWLDFFSILFAVQVERLKLVIHQCQNVHQSKSSSCLPHFFLYPRLLYALLLCTHTLRTKHSPSIVSHKQTRCTSSESTCTQVNISFYKLLFFFSCRSLSLHLFLFCRDMYASMDRRDECG